MNWSGIRPPSWNILKILCLIVFHFDTKYLPIYRNLNQFRYLGTLGFPGLQYLSRGNFPFSRQLQNTLASPQYFQRSIICQSPIKVWKVFYSQQELELVIWTSITNPSRKSAFFFYSNFSILLFSASIPVFEILSLIQYKLFKDGKLWGMVCLPLPFIISDKEVLVCLSRVFLAIMAV